MRLPVFQLSFKVDEGKLGLVFPSELSYNVQEFGFFIPVMHPQQTDWWPWPEVLINRNNYYFPVDFDGEYRELKANVSYAKNGFDVSMDFDTGNTILNFEVVSQPYSFPKSDLGYLKYIGNYRSETLNQFRFLPLVINDIKALNDLFLDRNGIFVGFTREFGIWPGNFPEG